MPNLAVGLLTELQHEDGGWGPYPGSASRTEATALAALALGRSAEDGADAAARRGHRWLRDTQLESGAWPLARGFDEPSWSTSMAVLALSFDASAEEGALRGADWLLDEESGGPSWWVRLLVRMFPERQAVELDAELTGWPWATGTFSWVEPTSYALIALKRLRNRLRDRRMQDRLGQGDRLLVDRACAGGGWNYGNPRVLGEELWPFPDTTAVALLALADRPDLPEVGAGLSVVPSLLEENDSILALSLGALALGAHGRERSSVVARLGERLAGWTHGETRALAWAALALNERPDVMELSRG